MLGESIKNLLKNTDLPLTEIAERLNTSSRTVRNINQGITHQEVGETYPLRTTGDKLSELKNRLSKPTKDAVLNPHVLSPQLLDYLGFLSILEVDIDCLLIFKDVYYKQLVKIFGRELSDQEILSIIKLEPNRPTQLKEMVQAHKSPKVRLINLNYWIKKGIIEENEKDMIYSLLVKR